jgi:hypothetical protein
MPDRFESREEIVRALEANRQRQQAATDEIEAVREILRALLSRGRALGVPVAVMARAAGISRETAHKLLRQAARHTPGGKADG